MNDEKQNALDGEMGKPNHEKDHDHDRSYENDLDFYDYKKHKETLYDQKEKDYTYKGRSIGFMFSNNKKDL